MSCVPSSHSIILNPWATAIAKVHDGHWAERRGKFLLLYASQTRGVVCYCSNQLWPISPMVFKLSFCSPDYSTLFCKDTVAYWFDGEILCVKGSNFRLLYCPKSTYTSLFILLQQLVSRTRKKVTFLNNRFLTVLFLSLFIKMQISPNLIIRTIKSELQEKWDCTENQHFKQIFHIFLVYINVWESQHHRIFLYKKR